jgi:hypothetical protein
VSGGAEKEKVSRTSQVIAILVFLGAGEKQKRVQKK